MEERTVLSGRDVDIFINGQPLLQAERAQLHKRTELHRVRACFMSENAGLVEGKREYKLNLVGVRFCRPFENCNFYDLYHFTVEVRLDRLRITLEDCLFDDFQAVADQNSFREHISITALRLTTEDEDAGA